MRNDDFKFRGKRISFTRIKEERQSLEGYCSKLLIRLEENKDTLFQTIFKLKITYFRRNSSMISGLEFANFWIMTLHCFRHLSVIVKNSLVK